MSAQKIFTNATDHEHTLFVLTPLDHTHVTARLGTS